MKTLKTYYDDLPAQTSPKTDFIRDIANKCQTSEQTVRFWIYDKFRPSRKEFYHVLSEATGIPEADLFM
jgi:hypothetical protein